MKRISDRICYLPASGSPLSADVFCMAGDARYYVFDVGMNDDALSAIQGLDKPVTVILSHFHRDHTGNMSRLGAVETLVGARTRKQLGMGTLVNAPLVLHDGVTIEVRPCVSPHAPGCLIATVDGQYTLLGDLTYAQPGGGQGEAKGMLNVLKGLNTRYFLLSHREGSPVVTKEALLGELRAYFGFSREVSGTGRQDKSMPL